MGCLPGAKAGNLEDKQGLACSPHVLLASTWGWAQSWGMECSLNKRDEKCLPHTLHLARNIKTTEKVKAETHWSPGFLKVKVTLGYLGIGVKCRFQDSRFIEPTLRGGVQEIFWTTCRLSW